MTEPPAVFADTNVLVPVLLRNILLEFSQLKLVRLRWSPQVLVELERTWLKIHSGAGHQKIRERIEAMNRIFPEAQVVPDSDFTAHGALPDPGDLHVLAGAIGAGCTKIVTFNLKHFPVDQLALEPVPIEAVHPDDIIVEILSAKPSQALLAVTAAHQAFKRPPVSKADFLDQLRRIGLRQTAELLISHGRKSL